MGIDDWDLCKVAQREWEPLGEQRLHGWRKYLAPDGGVSLVDEDPEVTDAMVERVGRALNLEAGRQRGLAFEDDWDDLTEQERGGWRLCARAGLAAAFSRNEAPAAIPVDLEAARGKDDNEDGMICT